MIKEIKLPEIADNVTTAVVLEILVSVGDKVEKDDTLAEMESDKATLNCLQMFRNGKGNKSKYRR
jgi:pyruvate dehydrogenase E2 component (dihydrolipoamide acetyltransferase)